MNAPCGIPNTYDFQRVNTLNFLENEKYKYDTEDAKKKVECVQKTDDAPVPKKSEKLKNPKEETENPEILRQDTRTFLENEKSRYCDHDDASLETSSDRTSQNKLVTSHSSLTKEPIDVDKERERFIGSSWPVKDVRSQVMAVTDSRIDYNGLSPKKFTTTCYLKPRVAPVWYTESLEIKLNSTKRVFKEAVYFKTKLEPHYWSEYMITDIKQQKSTYTKTVTPEWTSNGSSQQHMVPVAAN